MFNDVDDASERIFHGARNPKTRAFSIKVTEDINSRVEQLADAAGMNKSTMAAIAIAAGLRQLEAIFLMQKQARAQVEQYVQEQSQGMVDDIVSVAPPGFIK